MGSKKRSLGHGKDLYNPYWNLFEIKLKINTDAEEVKYINLSPKNENKIEHSENDLIEVLHTNYREKKGSIACKLKVVSIFTASLGVDHS